MSEEDLIRLEAERLANQLLNIAASLVALGDAGTIHRMSDELGGWAKSRAERAEVTALFGVDSTAGLLHCEHDSLAATKRRRLELIQCLLDERCAS